MAHGWPMVDEQRGSRTLAYSPARINISEKCGHHHGSPKGVHHTGSLTASSWRRCMDTRTPGTLGKHCGAHLRSIGLRIRAARIFHKRQSIVLVICVQDFRWSALRQIYEVLPHGHVLRRGRTFFHTCTHRAFPSSSLNGLPLHRREVGWPGGLLDDVAKLAHRLSVRVVPRRE